MAFKQILTRNARRGNHIFRKNAGCGDSAYAVTPASLLKNDAFADFAGAKL
jgi:hypothetical protein